MKLALALETVEAENEEQKQEAKPHDHTCQKAFQSQAALVRVVVLPAHSTGEPHLRHINTKS